MLDTSNYGPASASRNDIESDPFCDENKEEEQNVEEVEANNEKEPGGDGEKENMPLLRFTKKRSLPTTKGHLQMQRRIKRGRFLSPLSNEESETGDESDSRSYTPSRPHHTSSAQPTSSHSTGLEGDTNDEIEFTGGRSRTGVIYE